MAMEPPTTKTWFLYNQNSWQSELSREFSWKDQRETSLKKSIKGTGRVTRKSQWQKQQGNSSKHQVRQSVSQNGQKTKNYSSSEARSMFSRIRTYEGK